MWATGFLAPILCNMWPCSAKTKPKNCQKETGSGDGNQIPPKSTSCLRRSPVPDLWLLKCQRYLHHCAGDEEGLRRANSILCCNFDLTVRVALGSSTSLCFSPPVMSYFHFSCSLSMYSNEILSYSWLGGRTISDAFVKCQVQYASGLSGSPLSTDASIYADTTSPSPPSFPEVL